MGQHYASQVSEAQELYNVVPLGTGESGKSTLFKQLNFMFGNVSIDYKSSFKSVVQSNIAHTIDALINASQSLNISLENPQNIELSHELLEKELIIRLLRGGELDIELYNDIQELWKDGGIQKAYARRSEFQLYDSTYYFFTDLDRIKQIDYIPNMEDCLRLRIKTTGQIIRSFSIDPSLKEIQVTDIGGTRAERKKWLNITLPDENNISTEISLIAYCFQLSDFDQMCYEDNNTNRLEESIQLLKSTLENNSLFAEKTRVLLLFTKGDILLQKLQENIKYNGELDYEIRDELKGISTSFDLRLIVNSIVTRVFKEIDISKIESFHFVNCLCQDDVREIIRIQKNIERKREARVYQVVKNKIVYNIKHIDRKKNPVYISKCLLVKYRIDIQFKMFEFSKLGKCTDITIIN